MIKGACAFTGHRPDRFCFGYDEKDERCLKIKEVLAEYITAHISAGVNTFYTGMALGVDIWAAEIVLGIKEKQQDIQLIAVRPCETQANRWSDEQRERYYDILAKCDDVKTLKTHYTRSCMMERNRFMIDHADFLLAVYDGGAKGGTAYTVKYAKQKQRRVTIIHPDSLEIDSSADLDALRLRGQFNLLKGKDE